MFACEYSTPANLMETPNLIAAPTLVGVCVDDKHPELAGFFEVEYFGEGEESVRTWLAALRGVQPRRQDSVLLSQPQNWAEPVIVGVLESTTAQECEQKSSFEVRQNNVLVLRGDEPIQIVAHDGRKLVEIGKGRTGPTIRICQKDAAINLPGSLSISAGQLTLQSYSGDVRIQADREVTIEGDLIRLN